MAVIGAVDGTGISTEKEKADQQRRIEKYGTMLLTGVATMDADVSSARR
jgi:hypothetical protein